MEEIISNPMMRLVDVPLEDTKEVKDAPRELTLHKHDNEVTLRFPALSQNEGFARMAAAAFVTRLDPTIEELSDLKTAISEAVTNAIIHGYEKHPGEIRMYLAVTDMTLYVEIEDYGEGIPDVRKAREPMFTTKPEQERSGMGFAFMEAFMDSLEVISEVGKGTLVRMKKTIRA